jgi:hypothetical protein
VTIEHALSPAGCSVNESRWVLALYCGTGRKQDAWVVHGAEREESSMNFEVKGFDSRVQPLDMVNTIVSLRDYFETIRRAEIERARGRLGALSQEQRLAIETLTRGIVNKIAHPLMSALKTETRESEATTLTGMVKRLFNLHLYNKNSESVQNSAIPTKNMRTPAEKTGHRARSREPLSLSGL